MNMEQWWNDDWGENKIYSERKKEPDSRGTLSIMNLT
jgi:hypothetical protein